MNPTTLSGGRIWKGAPDGARRSSVSEACLIPSWHRVTETSQEEFIHSPVTNCGTLGEFNPLVLVFSSV